GAWGHCQHQSGRATEPWRTWTRPPTVRAGLADPGARRGRHMINRDEQRSRGAPGPGHPRSELDSRTPRHVAAVTRSYGRGRGEVPYLDTASHGPDGPRDPSARSPA